MTQKLTTLKEQIEESNERLRKAGRLISEKDWKRILQREGIASFTPISFGTDLARKKEDK